ncbi:unnamed protein product [Heligmosomoides polygyrus]|uniref:Uncharacterized protein n=1 Tax=Heligmosomoides polygyrus TaxID=6339 RepID=A0A183G882_HELPZ|nr:unnamed protein product [Heligmosomoides polygyrus]
MVLDGLLHKQPLRLVITDDLIVPRTVVEGAERKKGVTRLCPATPMRGAPEPRRGNRSISGTFDGGFLQSSRSVCYQPSSDSQQSADSMQGLFLSCSDKPLRRYNSYLLISALCTDICERSVTSLYQPIGQA